MIKVTKIETHGILCPCKKHRQSPMDDARTKLCTRRQQMQKRKKKQRKPLKIPAKKLKQSKTEFEVSGTLQGELLKRTPYGLSFNPIVASGKNAQILHYISQ